jgi:trk system potassium uptake protein
MRIVIVGAGAVGSYLAERLSTEGQDVVVIEDDEVVAARLQDEHDILVVRGNGASPAVLQEAGAAKADLVIAVSNNDGANVLACHSAGELGVKRTIARIEDPEMRAALAGLKVDVAIDPGEAAAHELVTLVRQSGVSELVEFGEGRLLLIGAMVPPASPLVGEPLSVLRGRHGSWSWVVAALVRHGLTIVAHGDTVVEAGDHALLMVAAADFERATALIGVRHHDIRRVIVMGSTRVAELAARFLLDEGFDVVQIDEDADRCRKLAERHPRSLVLCDDPTDPTTLRSLQLGETDAVLALTGWDEVNVLACLTAKALGAFTTISRFNRIDYVGLLGGVGIDAAISSRLSAAAAILRYVRRGRIHSVATFSDTDAEAIEFEVDPSSRAAGCALIDLGLPRGSVVGGVIRDGQAFVPGGSFVIEAGDRVIFFALPGAIAATEKLLLPT